MEPVESVQQIVAEENSRDLVLRKGGSTALDCVFDVESFVHEYYDAWGGTDLDRIMSFYTEDAVLEIPGLRMEGKEAVRNQFARPFITAFPGNRHIVKNMIFGPGVVNVEFSFEAQHKGAFAGHAATGARIKLPGCGVYEYDSAKRQITAGRIYFDVGTLLQTITDSLVGDQWAEDAQARQAGVRADVSVAFSKPANLREILRGCTEAIVRHLDAAFARIWMLNKDEGMLELQASAGMYTRLDGSYGRIPVGHLKVGSIAREKKAHLTNDVMNDPAVNDKRWAKDNGMVAFAGYPLVVEDRLIGVVALFARRPLSESILDTLASVADTIAQGIERKQAEEALRRSEAFLAEGQKLSHAGSWSFKPDGTFDYWSRELYQILGFDPEAGIPTISDYFTRVHPQDREVVEATIRRMIAAGEGCDLKKRIIRPDGVQRVIRCVGMPVRENGVVGRFVGTLMDITEQEELTQELRRREAYLAEAQKLSHTGSFGWKISTGEVIWSDETFRIFQYDRTLKPSVELVLERVHPDDAARVKETIEHASQDGQDFDFEHRLLMPDGSVKHLRVVARASSDELGSIEFVGAVMDVTAARQVEDRIRLIINTVPGLHWSARPDGWVNFINQRWLDYTGMTLEQALGWGWTPAYHADELEQVLIAWRAAVAEGKPLEMETRLRRFDGEYRWFLERVFPLFDSAGHILGWYGSDIDIHERKLAEAKIREQEIELQQILQLTPQHVFVLLPDGSPIYANQGALEYFGLDADQLLAESRINFVHPDDREHFLAERQKGFLTGAPHQFEARLRRHDGTFRWFLSRRNPLKDERGQILRWYVAGIDIEDRKRTEEALKASEAYLAEAQKLSHTGSWAWSPDTDVRYWSEECYRVLGFDPRDGLPRNEELIERIHPDDRAAFRESVRRATQGKLVEEVDYRIVHPGGTVRDIHSTGHPVFNASGDLIEYTGTVIDVTEHKRAEEAIRRSEAALQEARAELERVARVTTMGELAASIAHEINQPLAGVVTSANAGLNWLAANPPNLSKTRETLERILRDGTRGGAILARIRALLKRTPPAKTWVNVNQIVREVLALTAGELRQHQIELSLDLAPTVPAVLGDTVQLQQVLLNLIKNATEAMSGIAKGQRTLRIQSRLDELEGKPATVVEVSDTGMGFSGSDSSRLFEAFHTTKPQGMGMGLWISRSIIENHHGRLTASSNDGAGATFVIMLPKANQEPA